MAPRHYNKQRVLDIRKKDPMRKAIDIAIELGISRERVRQLLNQLGLPTNLQNPKQIYLCRNCGHRIRFSQRVSMLCFICRTRTLYQELTCDVCGKRFPRRNSVVTAAKKRGYQRTFCSAECNGRYNGTHFGFQPGRNHYTKSGRRA